MTMSINKVRVTIKIHSNTQFVYHLTYKSLKKKNLIPNCGES